MAKANEEKNVEVAAQTDTVILFKVNKALTDCEYEALEARVRAEQAKSGLKIVLAPFVVDATISTATTTSK